MSRKGRRYTCYYKFLVRCCRKISSGVAKIMRRLSRVMRLSLASFVTLSRERKELRFWI